MLISSAAATLRLSGPAPAPAAQPPPPDKAQAFTDQLNRLANQVGANGLRLDPTRVEFKVMLEVKADEGAVDRLLRDLRWTASALHGDSHNRGGDCSHKGDGGGSAFVRVSSPFMTVAGGGLRDIGTALTRLQNHGARPGTTGAMRLCIRNDILDQRSLNSLLRAHVAQEDVFYGLGQNGSSGRALGHKRAYAKPLSELCHGSPNHLTRVLADRHGGINTYTAGTLEFRYLDSSLNAAAVQANVALLLGTVKAAAEGRLAGGDMHAVGRLLPSVSRIRWDQFMNQTVGLGPVKEQLEEQFRAAGGRVQGIPAMQVFRHQFDQPDAAAVQRSLQSIQKQHTQSQRWTQLAANIQKYARIGTFVAAGLTVAALGAHFIGHLTWHAAEGAAALLAASGAAWGGSHTYVRRMHDTVACLGEQREATERLNTLLGTPAVAQPATGATPPNLAPLPSEALAFLAGLPATEQPLCEKIVQRQLKANPNTSAELWAAATVLFDRSNSAAGREVKRQGLDRLLTLRPDLPPQSLYTIAACVNDSKGWQNRGHVMQGIVKLFEAHPQLAPDDLTAITGFVGQTPSQAERQERLQQVAERLAQDHLVGPRLFERAGHAAAAVTAAPAANALDAVLAILSNPTAEQTQSVTRLIQDGNDNTRIGEQPKCEFMARVLRANPQIDPRVVDTLALTINRSTGRGRTEKLARLGSILERDPQMSAERLGQITAFVDATRELPERLGKLQALDTLLAADPQAELTDIMVQSSAGGSADERLSILNDIVSRRSEG